MTVPGNSGAGGYRDGSESRYLTSPRADRSMPKFLEPRFDVLAEAQKLIWPLLGAAPRLSLVLYGGTAVALHLGHRRSEDFDFFRAHHLEKEQLRGAFAFLDEATVIQDTRDSLVVLAGTPSGPVKVSFFGGFRIGRANDPLRTRDGTLLVASLDDLMATKLKAILDRAEAKDYRDIAAGVSLPAGLSAFRQMFKGEPSQVLRAVGYFKDGDLDTLDASERDLPRKARDEVRDIPDVRVTPGALAPDS
jgi:hypothetical protein